MKTTIDIDKKLLKVVMDLAKLEGISLSELVIRLLSDDLKPKEPMSGKDDYSPTLPINENARVGTLELVNRLRDN